MNAVLVFLRAALPWITVGLLYAVLFAIRGKRKKREEQPADYGAEASAWGCASRSPLGTTAAWGLRSAC